MTFFKSSKHQRLLWSLLLLSVGAAAGFGLGIFCGAEPPVGCRESDLTPVPDESFVSPASASSVETSPEPEPMPEKWVCLTFDDGPSKTTPDVLSALNRAGVKATFFVVATGNNDKYLPLISEAAAAGHQIALHSASHEYSDIYQSADAYWKDIDLLKERLSPYVRADDLHVERTVHFYDLGMSSADQQAEERKVGVRKLSVGQVQKVGEDVPLQMIDLHQRNVVGDRESFGERYAHQKRSQQTGAARESDRVDLVDRHAGLFQGRIDYRDDILLVGPGC